MNGKQYIPDDSLYLLDKRRIGELQRKNDGGVLIDGFYVVTGDYEIPEVYDGKNISAAADDGVFRLKVGPADLNNPEIAEARAVWIALPIPRADADAIVKDAFGVDSIEDSFCFDFESGIPQITAIAAKEMSSFCNLNSREDFIAIRKFFDHETFDDRFFKTRGRFFCLIIIFHAVYHFSNQQIHH